MSLRSPLLLLVLLYQSVALAASQIRANKVRSVLTTSGIVIGVASVTAVIAALTGLRANVLSEFEAFGTNKVFILPHRPDSGPMRSASWSRIRFEPALFDAMLEHCPSLASFTRITSSQGTVVSGRVAQESVSITGIEPDWHRIENRHVTIGRPFSLVDTLEARSVCLINPQLRDKLGLRLDPTGQSILVDGRRYIVVGVVEQRTESSMFNIGGAGHEVFVPFRTLFRPGRRMHVMAASRSPALAEEAKAEITFLLRQRRGLDPEDPDTFRVEFVEQYVQQFNAVAAGITAVATGVVGVSLLVGGVGIMNIMLVSVSERTREIGLRKAVGARPSAILLQFLVEAILLCCLGGAIGLLFGYGLTAAMRQIPDAQLNNATIPAWAVVLAFGFSAAVGLIFGMFPAAKAARLDPIEALRHE